MQNSVLNERNDYSYANAQNRKIYGGNHMRNPEETIGKMIDKASVSFLSYVDD